MEKIRINKAKNEVFLNFNKQFYSGECIKQALADFKESCDVEEKEDGILLKPKDEEVIDVVGFEFYNYVLGLMKNE